MSFDGIALQLAQPPVPQALNPANTAATAGATTRVFRSMADDMAIPRGNHPDF
jgi:hypothetical protein